MDEMKGHSSRLEQHLKTRRTELLEYWERVLVTTEWDGEDHSIHSVWRTQQWGDYSTICNLRSETTIEWTLIISTWAPWSCVPIRLPGLSWEILAILFQCRDIDIWISVFSCVSVHIPVDWVYKVAVPELCLYKNALCICARVLNQLLV